MTSAVEITAAKHFIDKGLPVNGAVALTCVLYCESKLNPGSQGNQPSEVPGVLNMHGAYGIASWNGPRQKGLQDYAMKHGLPIENLTTQQDFVLNEMANHYPQSWAAIRSGASYPTTITTIVAEYETPADIQGEANRAEALAAGLLVAVKDYIPGVPPASVPVPVPAPVPIPAGPPIPTTEDLQMPIALILQLIAPLAESLVTGLLKGALTHAAQTGTIPLPTVPPHPSIPAAPASGLTPADFEKIAAMIAAAIAQLQQPAKPAA